MYNKCNETIDNNSFNNLYHATYLPLLDSIKKNGLGATEQTYWEDSRSGVVYLSVDEGIAISYAEANESVPEEWLDEIVVLEIKWDNLDPNYLFIDENVQDNDGVTLEYHKIIPWSDIDKIIQSEAKIPKSHTRRFHHTVPGECYRCPRCTSVIGIDSKAGVSEAEFGLKFCPHCGFNLEKNNVKLIDAILANVASIKPKASILYFGKISDSELKDMEDKLAKQLENKV